MKSDINIVNSKTLKIIASIIDKKLIEIKPESKLATDLDLEDYHYVDILVSLEDEFNMPFKLREIINMETVEELLDHVVQKTS
ncbi:MAG: acyl carrier protein [Candidatus Falkowbacteria bacterium]